MKYNIKHKKTVVLVWVPLSDRMPVYVRGLRTAGAGLRF
jgi:hypothetical protein